MEIQISVPEGTQGLELQKIKRKVKKVLKDLACSDRELSILLTDDHGISQLNSRYLGRKGPTNVLAFPMTGGPGPEVESAMLGDVVISVDTARREADALGEPLAHTLDRLLVHGILHLLGCEHEASASEAERMQNEEKRLLAVMRQ